MSANTFGITFGGSITEITNNAFGSEFRSACNTFGIRPFATPSVPPVFVPLAEYDFNNYTANSPTLIDDRGGADATILQETLNTFDATDPLNKFLTIYSPPPVDPADPTGGILLPNLSGIKAIEVWVNYGTWFGYGQYVLDARVGSPLGYWITKGDTIGTDWDNGKFYNNTVGTAINSTAGTPIVADEIANLGWRQLVFITPASTSIADDIALFVRYTGNQGMPISVGYVAVYNTDLTSNDIKLIFNGKCSRYGLSPIP